MNPSSITMGSVEEISPIGLLRRKTKHLATSNIGPPPNLPCGDLLGNRDHYNNICVPLYNASVKGDWEATEEILGQHKHLDLVGSAITQNYDTALHIAASAYGTRSMEKFVETLVNRMTKEQLHLQNKNYNTALCLAAASGHVEIAKIMVAKNKALLNIPGSRGMMPLYMASLLGNFEMVHYLYDNSRKMTGDSWTDQNRGWVLQKCVEADLFDISLRILADLPELVVNSGSVLTTLAGKTYAFQEESVENPFGRALQLITTVWTHKSAQKPRDPMRLLTTVWTHILKLPKATIDEIIRGPADILRGPADVITREDGTQKPKHSSRLLFIAAEMGNTIFLVELIRRYPDLIWKTNDNNQTIFHVAVSCRHEGIYNLMYEIGSMKDMITPLRDREGNNMLHLAGKSPKKNHLQEHSGSVLQMQHELLWFKEVETMVPPCCREWKDNDGKTPIELFMEEHRDMLSTNEKLLKETATQCMVAAALMASIGFAAAFTVPGGYNQNTGIPMFIDNLFFLVFAISDAISLAFSSISIIVFLSIFISRYAARDFMESLPKKLVIGLTAVFFSIATMLVGFVVSFFALYKDRSSWVPVTISTLILLPLILYFRLSSDFLRDAYLSVYGSRYIFKPKNRRLYYQNPHF